MAFFKFRKDGAEPSAPPPATESLDAMRKRARHRLIGAAALVLIGVVGFPLLFDSQPRPIDVDIAINIPDKNKVAPLAATPKAVVASQAEAPLPKAEPAEKETMVYPAPVEKTIPPAATVTPEKAQPAKASAPIPAIADTKPDTLATGKADIKNEAKAVAKSDTKVLEAKSPAEASKAQSLLDGKEPAPAASAPGARYVVQVGAFAEAQKAREARQMLEKAGFKTYTQIVTSNDGKRTRVRVGPIANKAEADEAAEKIKSLGLAAAVLTL